MSGCVHYNRPVCASALVLSLWRSSDSLTLKSEGHCVFAHPGSAERAIGELRDVNAGAPGLGRLQQPPPILVGVPYRISCSMMCAPRCDGLLYKDGSSTTAVLTRNTKTRKALVIVVMLLMVMMSVVTVMVLEPNSSTSTNHHYKHRSSLQAESGHSVQQVLLLSLLFIPAIAWKAILSTTLNLRSPI